jgi:hypothetical protein
MERGCQLLETTGAGLEIPSSPDKVNRHIQVPNNVDSVKRRTHRLNPPYDDVNRPVQDRI